MDTPRLEAIPLVNLLLDLSNPRHNQQSSQREAISTIAFDQGMKLVNLGEDIVANGLNPSDFPLVTPTDKDGMYIVLEGNRRVAAMKLITSPQLLASIGLPQNLAKHYKVLQRNADSIPSIVLCSVMSRDEARHWIEQKHTGQNNGVGTVMWDGRQTQRFRGMSPALRVIEMVEASDYIDTETKKKLEKIAITNVERILGTPDARRLLGVEVQRGGLIFTLPEEEALGRLSLMISDIANKRIKVSDLDTKEQRIDYATDISKRPLPTRTNSDNPSGSNVDGTSATGSPAGRSALPRKPRSDRRYLVPKTCRLVINQPRINKIYHELQGIDVEKYPNSCAVMLRVFIELSLIHYAEVNNLEFRIAGKQNPTEITGPTKELSLREKIRMVYEHMEKNGIAERNHLHGIKSLYQNKEHVLSVGTLNAYVHNKDFQPKATDLKTDWDNIQPFVERLWSV